MKNDEVRNAANNGTQNEVQVDGRLTPDLLQANPEDVAEFIAASLLGLRKLAVTFKMRFLIYLIEMAYYEAKIQMEDGGGKDAKRAHFDVVK